MYSVDTTSNRYNTVGGNALTYDAAGNLTTDKDGYKYTYDYENRIINIKNSSDTDIVTYTYDALNRRIKKTDHITSSNTRTYYYSDNWQVLATYDSSDNQKEYYFWGNYIDEALYASTTSGTYYYVHDHLFSPAAIVNSSGTVLERYEYDAYGSVTIWDGTFTNTRTASSYGNVYFFTGRRLDVLDDGDFEIMYYRNRYYDTHAGRFITHDPLGITPDAQVPNKFVPWLGNIQMV